MDDSRDDRYRRLLATQLALTEQTWRTLRQRGVTPTTEVRLDFSFRAPTRPAAEALKLLLEDRTDYSVLVQSAGPFPGRDWTVSGSTQPTMISGQILEQWVDWMVTAGLECDCEFDGWGTQV